MNGRISARSLVCATAITLLLMFGVATASADTFTSNLNVGNPAISGFPAPYGTVTVTLNSATMATITFTANESNANAYTFGDGGTVGVNVNATSFTLGGLAQTSLNGTFTTPTLSNGGAGNEDGFGSFNQTINSSDGFPSSSETVTFTVTDNSGTWANAASVLTANAGGFDAAAHVFVCTNPAATCTASSGAVTTGFAAENGAGVVTPEPTSMLLLGSSLLGVAVLMKKRIRRSASN